ncbi:MAG: hypothetical protein RIC85_05805 [Gammaproteobacteria bacterium]
MSDKDDGIVPNDKAPDRSHEHGNEADRDGASRPSVTDTARGEIGLAMETEQMLDRHDERWKEESKRLANSSLLTFDMDGAQKSWQEFKKEHDLARTQWELAKNQIYKDYADGRDEIREEGTTLREEFSALAQPSVSQQSADRTRQEPGEEQHPEANIANEDRDLHAELDQDLSVTFNAQAHSHGRTR